MAKDKKIAIETRFNNGAISFKMADGRLCKLSGSAIDELMDLIKPNQFVRGDMVGIFIRYWLDSPELILGPNHEQREQWNNLPRWEHEPYLTADEFIMILGLLHQKDLSLLADFAAGTEFRNSLAYRSWHQQNERNGGYHNPERHSKVATTVVTPEQWEAMKGDG